MIKTFEAKDIEAVMDIFYDSVHHIKKNYYSAKQLSAWAPLEKRAEFAARWLPNFLENHTFIYYHNEEPAGFIEMTETGYIDKLYVKSAYQKQHVAQQLYDKVVIIAKDNDAQKLSTHASEVAKHFFLHNDFTIKQKQEVIRKNIVLHNYVMEKQI